MRSSANGMREAKCYLVEKIVHNSQSISLYQEKYVDTLVLEMGFSKRSASRFSCDISVDLNTKGEGGGDESFPTGN